MDLKVWLKFRCERLEGGKHKIHSWNMSVCLARAGSVLSVFWEGRSESGRYVLPVLQSHTSSPTQGFGKLQV